MRLRAAWSTLLLAAVLGTAASVATTAGASPSIVGGEPARSGAYPAQAEVDIHSDGTAYLCGGTLVAPQWVLTAGHCATNDAGDAVLAPSAFVVQLGSIRLGRGLHYAVDAVRRYPLYDPRTLEHDAALLHLATAAPQPPMPILTTAATPYAAAGALGRVVGWGATAEGGPVSQALMEVDVPIVADATCSQAYGRGYDAQSMLCAGYAEGGRDACQGDSGGPLMVDTDPGPAVVRQLASVVSGGEGCAEPDRYGIYTRLWEPVIHSWLLTTTRTAPVAEAPAPTPAATAVPTPAVTPGPAAAPPARARISIPRRCTARACRFTVTLAAGGSVRARVTVSRAVARRLQLSRRTVASRARTYGAAANVRITLTFPGRLRRALRLHGVHSVKARLAVTALTAGGRRADAHRTVRLRRP